MRAFQSSQNQLGAAASAAAALSVVPAGSGTSSDARVELIKMRHSHSFGDAPSLAPPDQAVSAMFHALGADVSSFPSGYWSEQTHGWIAAGGLTDVSRIDFTDRKHASPSEENITRRKSIDASRFKK